jgi:ribonucleoside-diphosphate reductase alpha chain
MSNVFRTPIAEQMWDMKYRYKDYAGTPIDLTVQDTWTRIAEDLASCEVDSVGWAKKFYEALESFKFIPAGRINAGAGTGDRKVTLFNCFVMGTLEDSLSGIYDGLKDAVLTMQQGGGIGYDFSTLRPKGAEVKGVASDSSGPLTFMDVWDSSCRTIMSAGVRRGAMMATMRVDHPDVEDFIAAKRDPLRLRMFNMSVLITDKFMAAVKANEKFDLVFDGKVYKTINAKSLWDKIMSATYNYAEPGVIFIDRINEMNNLNYCETIACTNPCLHPDSVIETVDGRVKIKDIKEPTKVYTMKKDGSLGISKSSASWVSKKGADTLKIKVNSGKEVICTPDHKIYVDGTGWVQAKDLKVGDQLVHLCRARRGVAYSGIKLTTEHNRAYRMEHRFIAEGAYEDTLEYTHDVHHIDGDTYNNCLDNLEVMCHKDHATLTRLSVPNDHMVSGYNDKGDWRFISTDASNKGKKSVVPMPEHLKSNLKNKTSAAVCSIEIGPNTDVYDISVEGTHNFIADFLVVHNCGEQPLPPYGACLLGSINLVALLDDFDYKINERSLQTTVSMAVRMMDNVVDVSKFPLPQQEEEAKAKRRIGLGVTGLADALALVGIAYGSDEAVEWTDKIMKMVSVAAYQASIDLAKEKGSFPLFDANKFLATKNMRGMPKHIRAQIREHGIRNALLTSIAPTGTISLYAGNVSSGIEPIFALGYERKVMQKDGSKITEVVEDYGVTKWKRDNVGVPLPKSFVTAQTLTPNAHVRMQAAAQRWVDSSISKTINCPEDIDFDSFKQVYMDAYDTGCKGCTTYRPNDVTGSVLTATEEGQIEEGGACEIKYDEDSGQLIRSCE